MKRGKHHGAAGAHLIGGMLAAGAEEQHAQPRQLNWPIGVHACMQADMP